MSDKDILIFLADDDEDDRLIFEEAISEISGLIRLVKAQDGIKLLQMLTESIKLPDIIFLDLNMPFQSGKETLKAIRANKQYHHIPVVIYSTSANPADIEETFQSGGSLYLEKPYSMCSMVKKLEKIFSLTWDNSPTVNRKDYFISSRESNSVSPN
jgi:CheY-like chemotaxis protein